MESIHFFSEQTEFKLKNKTAKLGKAVKLKKDKNNHKKKALKPTLIKNKNTKPINKDS